MQINDWLVPLIGVLGTTGVWQYLQFRQKNKLETEKHRWETSTDTMYRDDLKKRVIKLEGLLEQSSQEKDEMRLRIEELIAEVHSLRVEVDYLKRENQRLQDRR